MLLTACGHSNKPQEPSDDVKIRQKITGDWLADNGVVVFSSDESSSARFTNGTKELAYETTWEVKGRDIIITVTNITARNTTNHESVGTVEQVRIVRLDDSNLVWDYNGLTNTLKRKQ